ncbi:conjugal transfer protein TraK [Salegentibacter sp. LM13S]|uniref:conjugal transfer protein TraK n=1 Tax=Salegentibacter lacus TaxID=2873599 RepID=UPI001CCA6F34|nr:conjugal transfer protein TraK [Salegentibacter lacus]MBZ9629774.1 conjugal transfer protein TraK [Salegentibacter lacus]
MKTPYTHIYKVLRLNRFIVLSVLLIAFASSLISLYQVRKVQQDFLNKAFAIGQEGTVLPLELVNQQDQLEVEARSHLDRFHRYFYDLNTSNYKDNLEKALWLGNSSVDQVYRQKKADGVYNRLLQYSLVQKVTQIESSIDLSQSPYSFEVTTGFEINRGSTTERYQLITSGELLRVDRNFPHNPHGLLITNFFENQLIKQNDEHK